MRVSKLFFISVVFFLISCSSSEVTLVSNNGEKVSLEEVSHQLNEWQIQQEKLEKLSALESDLQMLVKAITVNNELSALPKSLNSEKDVIIHGSLEDEIIEETDTANDASLKQAPPGNFSVTIGSYLSDIRATQQKERLITTLPNLLTVLQVDTSARQQQNITLYDLQVNGFNSPEQAKAFCFLLIKKGGICKLS